MTFEDQITALNEQFAAAPDEVKLPIVAAREDFTRVFNRAAAIKAQQKLPEFRLPDALGREVSSTELLARGPLLITFYRGGWCPYCNIALHHLQSELKRFQEKGVTLVAISPELPDHSLSTAEKHSLEFPVLSDQGNRYARSLGLVCSQPESLRPVFEKMGFNLTERNGDSSFEIPVPATLLVDKTGVVRETFIDPDYTKRLDPKIALKWIDSL